MLTARRAFTVSGRAWVEGVARGGTGVRGMDPLNSCESPTFSLYRRGWQHVTQAPVSARYEWGGWCVLAQELCVITRAVMH